MTTQKEPMDLTGQKYGKLLVIGYGHKEGNYHYYDCLCDCSKDLPSRLVVKIKGKHLRDGSTQSCGCIRSERATKLPKDNSSLFTKSEIKELPYYNEIKRIWKTNRSHCNPNNGDGHQSYIKKGIKFCDEWDNGFLGFIRFYLFCIDNGYVAGQSQIHRKNNMLGFSPENLEVIDKPKRKKKEAESKNKNDAKTKNALLYVLLTSLKLLHPFIPFITEEIYQTMPIKDKKKSLMIESWPE